MADELPADIASSLIIDAAPATETPVEEVETQAADETELDVTTDDAVDEDEEQPEADSDTEDEVDEDSDGSQDTYTFPVDGEPVTATVEELIKKYSIEGAAIKRLQEATEIRTQAVEDGRSEGLQQAKAEIATHAAEVNSAREQISHIVGVLEKEIFTSRVPRPDPSMQEVDPMGYLNQMENWRTEQGRIGGMQQLVAQVNQQKDQHAETQKAENKRAEQVLLSKKRPELAEPKKAQAFTADVRRSQEAFGFTQAEINAFPDHRGLLVLEYAGRMLAQENAQGLTPAQKVVKKTKVKVMAPGAVVRNRAAGKKRSRADRDKALQSGDYKDVAKTLVI